MFKRIAHEIYQELADDSEPITWQEVTEMLNAYPRIQTGCIYTNEEQTEHKPTNNHIFVGEFTTGTNNLNILGAFKRVFDIVIPKNRELYVRVFPEIKEGNDEFGRKLKRFYARFVTEATKHE